MNRYLIVRRSSTWNRPQVLVLQPNAERPEYYRWSWSNTGRLTDADLVPSGNISAREIERMLAARSYLEISEASAPGVVLYLRTTSLRDSTDLITLDIVRTAMCDPPPPPPIPKTNHKIGVPKGTLP